MGGPNFPAEVVSAITHQQDLINQIENSASFPPDVKTKAIAAHTNNITAIKASFLNAEALHNAPLRNHNAKIILSIALLAIASFAAVNWGSVKNFFTKGNQDQA